MANLIDQAADPSDPVASEGADSTSMQMTVSGAEADPGASDGHSATPSAKPSLLRRMFPRVFAWAERPWTPERVARVTLTTTSLVLTTFIMTRTVHLGVTPSQDLIFDNNTPTGGDFGAHVWAPDYYFKNVLPSGWYNGWSMDWYAGLPVYRFYMVLPAIIIGFFNLFLPYGVAMKLTSVLGLILMPLACWSFGRLANFRYPMPEAFAFAGLAFVLQETYEIYGGNLLSTMAGEFSFSIALTLGIFALGVLARGLQTGKYRILAPVLIAAACVSHGIVLIFVSLASLVFCLVWIDRSRIKYVLTTGITSLLLIMWWVVPFLLNHQFMTDMKYAGEPIISFDSWWDMFFPLTAPLDILVTSLAITGLVFSVVRRQINGVALGVLGLLLVAGVYLTRDGLPIIGLLWNPRVLPFLYLVEYLLMAVGAIELMNVIYNTIKDRRALDFNTIYANTSYGAIFAVGVLIVLGFMFQTLPFFSNEVRPGVENARYGLGPIVATADNRPARGPGWSAYNFEGYEGRGESWLEYKAIVDTMNNVGVTDGCGRAIWENSNEGNGPYGTPMALMLLPYWTDSCIGSMEGLYFEASGTTPYHFLTANAISEKSSNPVRKLRYLTSVDMSVGVSEMNSLGVRYAMLRSDVSKAAADENPDLELIAQSGPWNVYRVVDSEVVVPLKNQPVVVDVSGGDIRENMLELGTSWFQNPGEWDAMPATSGPSTWQHITVAPDENEVTLNDAGEKTYVDVVKPTEPIKVVPLPEVNVSNVDMRNQSIGFDVDKVGVPVQVKVSYFPNWKAKGAEGPYRIGPNMMVVIPTSNHVEMQFTRTFTDYFTFLLTLVGIGLLFVWWRQGPLRVTPVEFGADTAVYRDPEQADVEAAVQRSIDHAAAIARGDLAGPTGNGASSTDAPSTPPSTSSTSWAKSDAVDGVEDGEADRADEDGKPPERGGSSRKPAYKVTSGDDSKSPPAALDDGASGDDSPAER